jgi:hypothetical protein
VTGVEMWSQPGIFPKGHGYRHCSTWATFFLSSLSCHRRRDPMNSSGQHVEWLPR